jgi:hypothetical protein
VFEKRALRRIFGSKRNEVSGDWRRLHNEELHNLYASLNIIKVVKPMEMRGAGHVSPVGEMGREYKILIGKPEVRRPRRRPRRKWEDIIRMDFREIGWEDVDWICLTQDREQWQVLINIVMNLRFP